jgi:hypothetical protein
MYNQPTAIQGSDGMNQQEELETLRASESIKHANLQELARLVFEFGEVEGLGPNYDEYSYALNAMTEFAKGVKQ